MPDNDIVPRWISWPWRRAFAAALEGASADAVGDEIRKAAAQALRRGGGWEGIADLGEPLRFAAVFDDLPVWEEARRRFVAANDFRQLSQAIAREADALLATDRDLLSSLPPEGVVLAAVSGGLERMVDACVWGRGRDLLLPRFGTYGATRDFELQANARASLPELSRRLLSTTDPDLLRAPASKVQRDSTADLLYEDLG